VNIVHASPDAPAVDIYGGGTAAVENLTFGTATGWVALPAGEHGGLRGHGRLEDDAQSPPGIAAACQIHFSPRWSIIGLTTPLDRSCEQNQAHLAQQEIALLLGICRWLHLPH
jgi:hypothetical protein